MVAADHGPGLPAPWSPTTMEFRVTGFCPKTRFSGIFRVSSWLAPVIFSKSDFSCIKSVDLHQTLRIHCWNHWIIIGCLEIANRPIKKAHFLPTRSWNRQDRCCRHIEINQCLKFHRHPTSNNMWIQRRSSREEFQKTRRGPRLFKRLGGQLMRINDPFYDKLMRSLTHYFERPNQKQANGSYKSKDLWH